MAVFPRTAGGGEWLNNEMDYYFYLPLLLSWSGESGEKECGVVGESCQQQTFFLASCFSKSDGQNAYIPSLEGAFC